MIEKISRLLALQISEKLNEKEKISVYCYGLQIIINTLISFLLVIVIGIFIGKPIYSLFYLFSYCSIRLWAGGYHASSNEKCIFLFALFFIGSVVGTAVIAWNKVISLLCLVMENILLLFLAPIGTKENPIPTSLTNKMKKRAVLSSLLVSCLIMIQNDSKMAMYGLFGSLWVTLLVVFGKILKELLV